MKVPCNFNTRNQKQTLFSTIHVFFILMAAWYPLFEKLRFTYIYWWTCWLVLFLPWHAMLQWVSLYANFFYFLFFMFFALLEDKLLRVKCSHERIWTRYSLLGSNLWDQHRDSISFVSSLNSCVLFSTISLFCFGCCLPAGPCHHHKQLLPGDCSHPLSHILVSFGPSVLVS